MLATVEFNVYGRVLSGRFSVRLSILILPNIRGDKRTVNYVTVTVALRP